MGWDGRVFLCGKFSTEYDQVKVPPYNGSDPTSPCICRPKKKHRERYARTAHEVRHGTSSINFHRAVPRSSSHTGPGEVSLAHPWFTSAGFPNWSIEAIGQTPSRLAHREQLTSRDPHHFLPIMHLKEVSIIGTGSIWYSAKRAGVSRLARTRVWLICGSCMMHT